MRHPTPQHAQGLGGSELRDGNPWVRYEYVATRSDEWEPFTGDGPAGANMHKVDVTGLEVPNNRSQGDL